MWGTVVSLPDQPASAAGEFREVAWTIAAGDEWLRLEGADGLWLHVGGETRLLDGWPAHENVLYGHDGHTVHDLGGALRIDGAEALLIADTTTGWRQRSVDSVQFEGTAIDAEALWLYRDEIPVGRIPLFEDTFDVELPSDITHVIATAPGHADSEPVSPGIDRVLELGGTATVEVTLAFRGASPQPATARWTRDEVTATAPLSPTGGTIAMPSGTWDLIIDAGPQFAPVQLQIELSNDEFQAVGVELAAWFETPRHLLASWITEADRSRTWRGSNPELSLIHI